MTVPHDPTQKTSYIVPSFISDFAFASIILLFRGVYSSPVFSFHTRILSLLLLIFLMEYYFHLLASFLAFRIFFFFILTFLQTHSDISRQTRILFYPEGLLTEFIFEHALRQPPDSDSPSTTHSPGLSKGGNGSRDHASAPPPAPDRGTEHAQEQWW
ncbi:hypothetical protein K438DRAFT_1978011 [Mycena galopus ATCC 62051]|nr:hypothetical protein K438DRAFT_1978011 [Mycena galopus ATCC 62051]